MTSCQPGYCKHVMHNSCTHCGREQYGPTIYDISHGKLACPMCGKYNSPVIDPPEESRPW